MWLTHWYLMVGLFTGAFHAVLLASRIFWVAEHLSRRFPGQEGLFLGLHIMFAVLLWPVYWFWTLEIVAQRFL